MSFTGTYSEANLSATAYNAFNIIDTSDFTDEPKNTFSGRRVWLIRDDGTYVSPVSQLIYTSGVNATATFTPQSVPIEGTPIGTAVNDPEDGFLSMPDYTVQAEDFGNIAVLLGNWVAALNANTYGYVFSASSTVLTVTARQGLGTTINGIFNGFLVSNINGNLANFSGGTDSTTETVSGLDYWQFSFGLFPDDEIIINTLTYDASLNIYVEWIPITPVSGSTYSAAGIFDFVDYAEDFMWNKILQMAANRWLWANKNFRTALGAARAMIDSSATCIVYQDQYESQVCIDFVVEIENNPNVFY